MSAAVATVKKKLGARRAASSARGRMMEFVRAQVTSGKKKQALIETAAVSAFKNDPVMVEGALRFLAAWAYSDSHAVMRRRAAIRIVNGSKSVFDGLESYLEPIDGRLLSILDMTKVEIERYVFERRRAVAGEIRHIDCAEEIASLLPSSNATPRNYFKSEQRKSALADIIAAYYEEA